MSSLRWSLLMLVSFQCPLLRSLPQLLESVSVQVNLALYRNSTRGSYSEISITSFLFSRQSLLVHVISFPSSKITHKSVLLYLFNVLFSSRLALQPSVMFFYLWLLMAGSALQRFASITQQRSLIVFVVKRCKVFFRGWSWGLDREL